MNTLGDDLLQRIFQSMSPLLLGLCPSVCSHWHSLIENSPALWNRVYMRERANVEGLGEQVSSLVDDSCQAATSTAAAQMVCRWKIYGIAAEQQKRMGKGCVTVKKWKGHSGRVNCCGMEMDQIATGSADRTVRIWSVKSRHCLEEYRVPCDSAVIGLEFDRSKVICAAGTEVLVWSRNGNSLLKRICVANQRLSCFCLAEPELVVGCADGSTRVMDMYSGRCSQIYRHHRGLVKCLAMDGSTPQILASGSDDGKVQLCDMLYGQEVASIRPDAHLSGITCVHMTSTGHYLYCGTRAGNFYCWDLRKRKELWSTKISTSEVTCMHQPVYGPTIFVAGGLDGTLRVLKSDTGELLSSYKRTQFDQPLRLATTENTVRDLARGDGDGQCTSRIVNSRLSTYQREWRPGPPDAPILRCQLQTAPILCVKMGSTRAVTGHTDNTVTLWNFVPA